MVDDNKIWVKYLLKRSLCFFLLGFIYVWYFFYLMVGVVYGVVDFSLIKVFEFYINI